MAAVSLYRWLKYAPFASSLRYTTDDGDERTYKVEGKNRNRWKHAQDHLENVEAVNVEALDDDGNVLRSFKMPEPDKRAGDVEETDVTSRVEKIVGRERREMAAMLDRYGDRLNEAFERGVAAASANQDRLVDLTDNLTAQLCNAITNLHNVSAMYVEARMAEGGTPTSKADELIGTVLGGAARQFMGGGIPQPPPKGNGKKG